MRTGLGIVAAVAILAAVGVLIVQQTGDRGTGRGQTPYVPNGPMPAITVAGDQILRGGQPWWFLGFNSFTWSDNCNDAGENMTTADVDAWFSSMRHDGHGAVRLFFFPGWNIERLDAAIASAKRNNIYVTLTLDNGIEGCGAEEKNADLIVVGNRGMTGASRFVLGSVPNKVSHHAPCSVMIVRTS